MSLTSRLGPLADRLAYPAATVDKRWGQLLREGSGLGQLLDEGRASGILVPLRDFARLQGGVVTRANAFFLVRELPFSQIPRRFRLTRRDSQRVAVVVDGLDTAHRIERLYLRPVLKGPESLLTPTTIATSDLRVLDVTASEDDLRNDRATGTLAYLKRGTTQDYQASHDSLKGGVPSKRSNIKNRQPYWYSLSVPESVGPRLILPEHVDRRYPVSRLEPSDSDLVVIDKLYTATPNDPATATALLLGLQSLLTWAQIELRGRTQLGQGVLELKKPDWEGILVLRPDLVGDDLLDKFAPLSGLTTTFDLTAVAEPVRTSFDELYLSTIGASDPVAAREHLERELIAGVNERSLRRESVRQDRDEQRRQRRTSADVDAYAARVAARLHPHPDPREFVQPDDKTREVAILGPVVGSLAVGDDLFSTGKVLADGVPIADAGGDSAARYVLGVLTRDDALKVVHVPVEDLDGSLERWGTAREEWARAFEVALDDTTSGLTDPRLREQIRLRALEVLHASTSG